MVIARTLMAAGFAVAIASSANAGLSFSFADPVPGRQVFHAANGAGPGVGLVTYDPQARLVFLVDGSTEPNNFTATFNNVRLELNLTLGAATTIGGVTTAPVAGTFTLRDAAAGNAVILVGTAQAGAFVRAAGTNSLQFSDQTGFSYSAGPALQALLAPGRVITDPQEAVFTVTDILTNNGAPLFSGNGAIASFAANASFSGNANVVPSPGAVALAGLGVLAGLRRRRA